MATYFDNYSQDKMMFWDGGYRMEATKDIDGNYWAVIDGKRVKIPPYLLEFKKDDSYKTGLYASFDKQRSYQNKLYNHYEEMKEKTNALMEQAKGLKKEFCGNLDLACSMFKKAEKFYTALLPKGKKDISDLSGNDRLQAKKYKAQMDEQGENKHIAQNNISEQNSTYNSNESMYIYACHQQFDCCTDLNDINNMEAIARQIFGC